MTEDDPADSAREERLRRLRRLAYSRAITPAERAAAADAQRELAEEEARDRVAATTEPADGPVEPGPVEPEPVADADEPPSKRLGRRALAIVSSAALLLGLGLGFGGGFVAVSAIAAEERRATAAGKVPSQELLEQIAANQRLSAIPSVGPGMASQIIGPGDSEAAARWFEGPQRPSDMPDSPVVPAEVASTLRLVYESEGFGRVWVARDVGNNFCFFTDNAGEFGGPVCTDPASFDDSGLAMTVVGEGNSITLRWDGWQVLAVTDVHSLAP